MSTTEICRRCSQPGHQPPDVGPQGHNCRVHLTGKGEMRPFGATIGPDPDTGAPPASESANGQFNRDRDRTPRERALLPELADYGGAAPLPFEDDRAMLKAAAATLQTFALLEPETAERRARLLLMSGFLRGLACR